MKTNKMPYWTIVILLSTFLVVFSTDSDTPTVIISSGILHGTLQQPEGTTNIKVEAYLGVQFARAPIDDLRFRPPMPVEPWDKPKSVDKAASTCFHTLDQEFPGFPGSEMWNAKTKLTEDCLNMNIWVPRTKHDGTVMVWIYGGGFFSGSPSLELYDGKELAAEGKVIVININYRLGPFGFLFLGQNSSIGGNMGLLDQQMALRWIRDNIASFGGDPNKVTLFGESAGSASVSTHIISRGSRNLFRNAILQSGTTINPWASATQSQMIKRSLSLAHKLGCREGQIEQVALCLRGIDHRKIQDAADEVTMSDVRVMEFPFVPVRQDSRFFPEDVDDALDRGHVKKCPILIGTNADEGSYWLPYILSTYGFRFYPKEDANSNQNKALITWNQYLSAINATFKGYLSHSLISKAIAYQYSDQYVKETGQIARRSSALRDGVSKFVADFFFTCDVLRFADKLVDANLPVYSYYFTQRSTDNPWPLWMGVMHAYEIEYIYGVPLYKKNRYTESERKFSRKMIKLWTDFARYGKPTADWPNYRKETKKYVVLKGEPPGGEPLFTGSNLNSKDCGFWKEAKNFLNRNDCSSGAMKRLHQEYHPWLCCLIIIHFIQSLLRRY